MYNFLKHFYAYLKDLKKPVSSAFVTYCMDYVEILAYLSHQIFSKWKTVLVSLSPHLTTTPTPSWTTLTKCPLTLLDPWLHRQTVDPRLTSQKPFESSPWWRPAGEERDWGGASCDWGSREMVHCQAVSRHREGQVRGWPFHKLSRNNRGQELSKLEFFYGQPLP